MNDFSCLSAPLFQSILINGRGSFNCSLSALDQVCDATNPECSPFVLTVVPGKTYRLRIASITSLSAFNFEIEVRDLVEKHLLGDRRMLTLVVVWANDCRGTI